MKIKSISLSNIKSFVSNTSFDFSDSDRINTISGINGSGKTTVFKSIILAQKLYFAKTYNLEINNNEELLNFFNNTDSFINIEFEFGDSSTCYFTLVCTERTKESVSVDLLISQIAKEKINEFWNLENPKNLIIYIDSNRNILEDNFSNEDFKLASKNSYSLITEYIMQPDKLFYNTYERLIHDYLRERIIPSTLRADLPHYTSKILIHNILTYLELSNFTALERKNQFILQVKQEQARKKRTYDVRNLSSGEKTLFYIFHFICYVKSIGMLIIDEPENNLHEDMLSKFIHLLNEITLEEEFSNLIFIKARSINQNINENLKKQLIKYYKDHKLSQIFLLTHSKNLIYNNFTIGKNFVMDDGLKVIDYENHEKVLRDIGLSKIINKVLFVEGRTENEILEMILSPYNIKIKALGGCAEVIDTYQKYYTLHTQIRDVQFCFLIDKDTRSESDIDAMRSKNPTFFDNHFIILDRHEIENYLLDAEVFSEIFKKHHSINRSVTVPNISSIQKKIKEVADENKEIVLKKTLRHLNQKSLHKIKLAISSKNIEVNDKSKYRQDMNTIFNSESITETQELLVKNFETVHTKIQTKWEQGWESLCDGKIVLNQLKSSFGNDLGIAPSRMTTEIIQTVQEKKSHEFNKIIEKILRLYV